jgi:lipoprotein-releasing system ATP-binding protein
MTSLVAQDVSKTYPAAAAGTSLQVLVEASLSLAAGESVAILGPSGSGKSTLLSILGTLERPTTGSVRLSETDLFALSEAELAAFRSRNIGFVFQDHHLLPQCTVLENVLIPFLANGSAGRSEVESAEKLLQRVGLGERSLHRPAQLSGGERQRVAIARALVRRPELLLADEPTGNLDRATAETVAQLLVELQREHNSMLVVVTHSESLAAKMQRRVELIAGRLTTAV